MAGVSERGGVGKRFWAPLYMMLSQPDGRENPPAEKFFQPKKKDFH